MDKEITAKSIWDEYSKMLAYNTSIDLDNTIRTNENMFIGRQWEGVQSNGLPTPVFNFLKRVVLFTVASVTSDNIRMKASPMAAGGVEGLSRVASVVNNEFDSLFEFGRIPNKMREVMRNAAVDGDGATYTYWDANIDAGNSVKGGIVTEVIENSRVGFGNTEDRNVQTQPYILVKRREITERLKKRAKELGCADWEDIKEDSDDQDVDSYKDVSGKTTVILRLWKNEKTGTVWGCESTRNAIVRKPWDLGLKLYPITWLNWDYIQDSYHGQAMITGLIPNQVFINKLFAMSMISLMTTAYPKIVYDKTRISKWDNGVGKAIGVNGGGVDNVAKILDPAQISPQIAQFIQMAVDMTQSNLGATAVAMGDTRPDNTSAIIALQRAASTPNEITKQNLYANIEDLGRIYIDFMSEYYGTRMAYADPPTANELDPAITQFAAPAMKLADGGKIPIPFDFSTLKTLPMSLKLDVGASAYWSEIASTQTLDNLLMNGQIDVVDYLERIPDGYISDRRGLINAVNARRGVGAMPEQPTDDGGTGMSKESVDEMPIPEGAGNGALQRAVAETL